jgi:hypothetical protein
MVLRVGAGPAKHRNDRGVLTPFDIARVGSSHIPSRTYGGFRPVTKFNDGDAWLAVGPLPCFRPSKCAAPPRYLSHRPCGVPQKTGARRHNGKGFPHLQRFQPRPMLLGAYRYRVLSRASGTRTVSRNRRTRESSAHEICQNPLGFVPTGGEMLVIKDWCRAFALLENPDNLLVEPPARIVFLTFEIAMINPVFSD